MAFQNNVPIPHFDPVVKPDRFLTEVWERWFDQLQLIVAATAVRVASVALPAADATIPPTDLSDGPLDSGLYRVSYYAKISTPGPIGSTLTISFTWTDGGVTQFFTGTPITGTTVSSYQSETQLIHVDALSPVQYFAEVSVGAAPPLQYNLYFTLEKVQG